jgi:prepilin-type N-terminal cleavage/methylation domain-containing protein
MGRVGDTAGALRGSERGFTLIELLVATTIGMVVLGGAVTVFIGAVRSEPRTASKVTAIQQGRVAVERLTRELRQGLYVLDDPAPMPSQVALITYVAPASCGSPPSESREPCRVTYNCGAGECTRTVAQPNGSASGAPVQVVSGLTSTDVFTYSPSEPETEPTYIGVELSFATREGGPVVIADGAALRNGES